MFDFGAFTGTWAWIDNYWLVMGGLFFLGLMGKATRTETRTYNLALIAILLAPTPATLYVVAILAWPMKLLDSIKWGV